MRFDIDVHHHHHDRAQFELLSLVRGLHIKLEKIMATQAELVTKLAAVEAGQEKTAGEIRAVQTKSTELAEEVAQLKQIIEEQGGGVSPELEAAVNRVEAKQKELDDAIPDVGPGEPADPVVE